MAKDTQISAQITETTRERMEKHVRRTGVKKGHLVEQAILHHLQALEEIPAEYVIHPRIVVSRKTGEEMLRRAEHPNPTAALRELMRDGD
jgi:predicted DNA-binding protein